jgi:hypothetical protein
MTAVPPPRMPTLPSSCVTRASTHLRMIRLGISEMETADEDRVILGFFSVAIFGWSVTQALGRLKTWDRPGFVAWYAPWKAELENDPLCKFFVDQRNAIIHDVQPLVGFVLASVGSDPLQVGTIHIPEAELPKEHRGNPIDDPSAINLCRLYLAFLQEMFDAFHPMVWKMDDRVLARYYAKFGQGAS